MNPLPRLVLAMGWHLHHHRYFLWLSIIAETQDLPSLLNLKIFCHYMLDCFFVFFRCNGTFSGWYYLDWQTMSMTCIYKYKMRNCRSGNFNIFSLGWFGSGWVQNSINCSNWGYIEQSQVWTWNWTCWQHVKYLLDEGMCVDPFWQEGMYPC